MDTTAPTPGAEPIVADATEGRILLHETDKGRALLDIIDKLERAEELVRYRNVLKYRKQLHYWNNVQYLVESSTAHDWMTPEDILSKDPQADIDPVMYAKVINVYKAHGEIIIGALTSGTPTVRFFPADADDHEDTTTAKACSKIAELIQRWNKARLLLMKSLFIMYNQAFVACYNEQKQDYRFGSLDVPDYEDVDIFERDHYCPNCGFGFGSEQWEPSGVQPVDGEQQPIGPGDASGDAESQQEDAAEPGEEPPQGIPTAQGPSPMSPLDCPGCQKAVQPVYDDTKGQQTKQVGSSKKPKNRECLEVYGPLNVKIPAWVREQTQTPYLDLETEESVYAMRALYPEIEDLIESAGYPDSLEREVRVPTSYRNDFPKDVCTVQRVWLRPMAYTARRRDDDARIEIEKAHADGVYVVIINKTIIAEIVSDKLDEHWTISTNPLSETLHAEPIGAPMMPIQDITNELANLTLETIEYGLPEIFASTDVLDFDAYQRQEARPGQISPATLRAGQTLSQGFHEIQPATLSREVELFADRMTTTAQFVMGTFPSVFGGSMESRGGSAKEYELSKASALQRISNYWIILQEWWAAVMGKSVRSYMKHMQADEKYVQAKGNQFLNVWIRQADLSGEIGEVEPEVNETFPISWAQKRDVILNLMQMKDPNVTAVIVHPENAGLIAQIIGVPELYIPGDDDRAKQLMEIAEMLLQQPQELPGPMGQPTVQSTVPIDPELDNHAVEAEICKAWLISEVGQDAKKNTPAWYMNVLAHFKEHKQAMMAMMPPPAPGPNDVTGPPGGEAPNGPQ